MAARRPYSLCFLLAAISLQHLLAAAHAGSHQLAARGVLQSGADVGGRSDSLAAGRDAPGAPHVCSATGGLSQAQVEGVIQRKCRVLCELSDKGGCDAMLQPCMETQRVRHIQKRQALGLAEPALAPVKIDPSELTFVVFFAVGKRNAEAYPAHHFVEPDMNFVRIIRKTHPGSRVVMLSDEFTQFPPDMDLELFRVPMDSDRLGRNAFANYYQYIGQREFLRALQANGSSEHVFFMDMDVLVLDSILELYCPNTEYGYGLTINANDYDPIDIGVQFVQASHYDEGMAFLQELIDRYLPLIGHPNSFTTGQVVMRNTLEMGHKDVLIPKIATAATKNNVHCRTVQGGKHRVCFFPCLRYNYWEDCTASVGQLLPQDPAQFREHGIKVMQFVAWRKPGLQVVADAFMSEGLDGAYRAFAALPHTEDEMKRRFASFNQHVKKVCYKDDKGCSGLSFADEGELFRPAEKQQQATAASS